MEVYTGEVLAGYLKASDLYPRCRDSKTDLDRYMASKGPRVMCLYGLRRTGKTVLMQQEMRSLDDPGHTLLVRCEEGDSMYQLKQALNTYPDCRYIFLDEVTRLDNFINTASVLADHYAALGKRVCMAGTDSLGFALAKRDELFDRVIMIHTTYIPFREYHNLLGKGIIDYIKYGGTLTDGNTLYNADRRTGEYTNSAIADNIVHSLQRFGRGSDYERLCSMVEDRDLASAIRKVLEANTGIFTEHIINTDFKSHDKGSLLDLLTQDGRVNPEYIEKIKDDEIRPFLYINKQLHETVSQKACDTIEQYLEELDVLYREPDSGRDIFIQPGMRYAQASELARALINNDMFNAYNDGEKRLILQKMESDICGQILEDTVFYQLVQVFPQPEMIIRKYRNNFGQEIDILVENLETAKSAAIEVKLSSQQSRGQWKHLQNQDFQKEIETVTGTQVVSKTVVYTGETEISRFGDGEYINAEEFLIHTEKIMQRLLSGGQWTRLSDGPASRSQGSADND